MGKSLQDLIDENSGTKSKEEIETERRAEREANRGKAPWFLMLIGGALVSAIDRAFKDDSGGRPLGAILSWLLGAFIVWAAYRIFRP
jgi:hypothetical protein